MQKEEGCSQDNHKRIGVNAIPAIDEVNIFKEDVVIQFTNPKVQASIAANTWVVSGSPQTKKNQPVRWTTPLGLPVVQPYFKTKSRVESCTSNRLRWYVTAISFLVVIPILIILLSISVQVNQLMDEYDNLWRSFRDRQREFLRANPNTQEVRYSMWLCCSVGQMERLKRVVAIYLTLFCYVLFVVD